MERGCLMHAGGPGSGESGRSQRRYHADEGAECSQAARAKSVREHTGSRGQEMTGGRHSRPTPNDAEAPGAGGRHLCAQQRRLRRIADVTLLFLALLLQHSEIANGDRAGDALFFDGGQEPFNSTDPPSPGFVYLTPRKSSRGLAPWVSTIFDAMWSNLLW